MKSKQINIKKKRGINNTKGKVNKRKKVGKTKVKVGIKKPKSKRSKKGGSNESNLDKVCIYGIQNKILSIAFSLEEIGKFINFRNLNVDFVPNKLDNKSINFSKYLHFNEDDLDNLIIANLEENITEINRLKNYYYIEKKENNQRKLKKLVVEDNNVKYEPVDNEFSICNLNDLHLLIRNNLIQKGVVEFNFLINYKLFENEENKEKIYCGMSILELSRELNKNMFLTNNLLRIVKLSKTPPKYDDYNDKNCLFYKENDEYYFFQRWDYFSTPDGIEYKLKFEKYFENNDNDCFLFYNIYNEHTAFYYKFEVYMRPTEGKLKKLKLDKKKYPFEIRKKNEELIRKLNIKRNLESFFKEIDDENIEYYLPFLYYNENFVKTLIELNSSTNLGKTVLFFNEGKMYFIGKKENYTEDIGKTFGIKKFKFNNYKAISYPSFEFFEKLNDCIKDIYLNYDEVLKKIRLYKHKNEKKHIYREDLLNTCKDKLQTKLQELRSIAIHSS